MDIGIIGAGDMGSLTAKLLDKAGYVVRVFDLPDRRSEVEKRLDGSGVKILDDGNEVARKSDLVIYAVETTNLDRVVGEFGPQAKRYAAHGGLTSTKHPEMAAFQKHLPSNANRVTCHQLYGPSTGPDGQAVVVMNVKSTPDVYNNVREAYSHLGSRVVELSTKEHDMITADTQGLTHLGFQSVGTAWKNRGVFPWENLEYAGGIDNIKALITLRLYGAKPHVNSGVTIFNPYIGKRVDQYDRSANELFWLMLDRKEPELRERVYRARDAIFGGKTSEPLLGDKLMGVFALGNVPDNLMPNSQLMLLAEVDTWYHLLEADPIRKPNPYRHLLCQTANFRIRVGLAEYLFRNEDMLEASIEESLRNTQGLKSHDAAFTSATKEWAITIRHGMKTGDPTLYHHRFETVQKFFGERIAEGQRKSDKLIRIVTEAIKNSNGEKKN